MKSARIVILGIALAAGGGAAFLSLGREDAPPPTIQPVAQLETVDVLVAKNDIDMGRALSAQDREAVDAATRAIVAKLLHRPVVRAKELHDAGDLRARLLAELFDLKPPSA